MKSHPLGQNKKAKPPHSAPSITDSALPAKRVFLWMALLAAALYANTLGHDFTVDDATLITNNTLTQQGLKAVPEIFVKPYRIGFHDRDEGLYRPIPVAVLATIYHWAGNHPLPYHVLNVVLYAVCIFLMGSLLHRLFQEQSPFLAPVATLLFLAHPIHTEVVANVKSMDEILAFIGVVLALSSSIRFIRSTRAVWLFALVGSLLLAFFSKESALAAWLLLPLTWYFFFMPLRHHWFGLFTTLVVSTVVYFAFRIYALGSLINFSDIEPINNSLAAAPDLLTRIATAIFIQGKYLRLLSVPYPLSFDYSYQTIPLMTFAHPAVWLTIFILAAMAFVALRGLRSKSIIAYGIWIYGVSLAPVSNLFLLIESTMAERFLFMPSLGFCIAVPAFLFSLDKHRGPAMFMRVLWLPSSWFLRVIMILLMVVYSMLTLQRNTHWRDNFTLLQRDVKTCPNSARIRYALGSTYVLEKAMKESQTEVRQQYLRKGIIELETGLRILPYYGDAWMHLGIAYAELKNYSKAAAAYHKALQHVRKPSAAQWVYAGIAFGYSGAYDSAFFAFRQALALNDTAFDAYNNMGLFYLHAGQLDSSIRCLQKAIQLRPANDKAYYNLGNTYATGGHYALAIEYYEAALQRDARNVDALINKGNCLALLQQYDMAIQSYEQALQLDPSNAKARHNLEIARRSVGDTVRR